MVASTRGSVPSGSAGSAPENWKASTSPKAVPAWRTCDQRGAEGRRWADSWLLTRVLDVALACLLACAAAAAAVAAARASLAGGCAGVCEAGQTCTAWLTMLYWGSADCVAWFHRYTCAAGAGGRVCVRTPVVGAVPGAWRPVARRCAEQHRAALLAASPPPPPGAPGARCLG